MSALFSWLEALYHGRVRPKLAEDRGATTLEYVIIAALICVAAVAVAVLIVNAINNYGSQIPNG
jgi:Flp pilus assembly pilin Flp